MALKWSPYRPHYCVLIGCIRRELCPGESRDFHVEAVRESENTFLRIWAAAAGNPSEDF